MSIANFSRRGFLKASLAGAALAMVMDPSCLIAATYEDDVRKLIRLHDQVLIERDAYTDFRYNSTLNEMIGHICDKFAPPPQDSVLYDNVAYEVRKLKNGVGQTAWRDIPPTLAPASAAIAAMRSLMAGNHIRINPREMSNFARFLDDFHAVILTTDDYFIERGFTV